MSSPSRVAKVTAYLFEVLRHGASGFLVEDTEPPDLTNAVRVVASGDSLISPRMTRRLIGVRDSSQATKAGRGVGCP